LRVATGAKLSIRNMYTPDNGPKWLGDVENSMDR
jgi:hypothetical protein